MEHSQKKVRTLLLGIGAIFLILIIGFIAMRIFASMKPEPTKRSAYNETRSVLAKKVTYTNIISNVNGSGRIVPYAEIDIIAEASGKIEQGDIPIKKGAQFSKGDIIAKIYSKEAQLSLQSQKSRFISSITRVLPDIRIDFPNDFETIQSFVNSLSTHKKFDNLPSFTTQKLEIFLASKQILSDFYAIQQAELALSRYTIYAPYNGSITKAYNQVGAYMNPGNKIVRIIQTDMYEIEIPIDVAQAGWIQKDQKVQVSSTHATRTWIGNVKRIADFVDHETQARSIFVEIPNDGTIVSGEFVTVHFIGEPIDSVIQIPRNALLPENKVYCIKNGTLQSKSITIKKSGTDYLLIQGIPSGDTIVIEPLVQAYENMQVRAILESEK